MMLCSNSQQLHKNMTQSSPAEGVASVLNDNTLQQPCRISGPCIGLSLHSSAHMLEQLIISSRRASASW